MNLLFLGLSEKTSNFVILLAVCVVVVLIINTIGIGKGCLKVLAFLIIVGAIVLYVKSMNSDIVYDKRSIDPAENPYFKCQFADRHPDGVCHHNIKRK